MAVCDEAHAMFDARIEGPVVVGELPGWTRVRGRVASWVYAGPYDGLGRAWARFHDAVGAANPGVPDGPPGDVYVCPPQAHLADGGSKLLTLFYLPIGDRPSR